LKVSVIFGTRPEAIKLCPLIRKFREIGGVDVSVCVTGQHRQMLDQVLRVFEVVPDADLELMQHNQSLASLTARAVDAIDGYLSGASPDLVIVQGDTTTTLCASMAAYYRRIPVAHVEAGLRTGNRYAPFPEELNRVLTTRIVEYHFAPTTMARENLIRENVPEDRIYVTGNTVIDALLWAVERVRQTPPTALQLPPGLSNGHSHCRLVLITGHRRESFGHGFESICRAIRELSLRFPSVFFVYPVHMNPNVTEPVHRLLSNRGNIVLMPPVDYMPFVWLLDRSYLVLTDSGGIQEEAPSLGKPVLVMRDNTERPEGVVSGTTKLVGTNYDSIVNNVSLLLDREDVYLSMAKAGNPYGDGNACERIVEVCTGIRP
jgi:UDP-N-acetylglucosamine 2-epimerase (non-hydrolysing)